MELFVQYYQVLVKCMTATLASFEHIVNMQTRDALFDSPFRSFLMNMFGKNFISQDEYPALYAYMSYKVAELQAMKQLTRTHLPHRQVPKDVQQHILEAFL